MSGTWRCRLAKLGRLRFLSHLDLMRAVARAFRRAGLDPAYSGGYHPHPLLAFGPALAVGVESLGEYFDITLEANPSAEELLARINGALPEGLRLRDAQRLHGAGPSLMAWLNAASYLVVVNDLPAERREMLRGLISRTALPATRTGADGTLREIDLRPLLLDVDESLLARGVLGLLGVAGSAGNLRPEELLRAVVPGARPDRVLRTGLYRLEEGQCREPLRGRAVDWNAVRGIEWTEEAGCPRGQRHPEDVPGLRP